MTHIYYEKDGDLGFLKDKKIAVIGYGNQGRGQARNLKDMELDVVVAAIEGSGAWNMALEDGMEVMPVEEAAKIGDFIQILLPDHVQPEVYESSIAPHLKPGNILGFSHGFNIHFGQIVPPKDIDVIMVAPKGPGYLVREIFEQGGGVPALLAIYQDYSKVAKEIGLAYAKGIGALRAGVIETTFKEETETDLFGEQVVLCGGVTELIRASFETLVEAGYQPEVAYFECCHELKLIVDLIHTRGITGMREAISDTAEYGDMTRGRRIITQAVRGEMKKILEEIRSGEFAKEWILENRANRPVYNALRKRDASHLLEEIGEKLRKMMSWLKR